MIPGKSADGDGHRDPTRATTLPAIPGAGSEGALADGGEAVMAWAACRLGLALLGPVVALAWWLRGPQGALTALGALALVIGVFALTGWSLVWAGRRGPAMLMAVALGGFGTRLGLYALAIVALEPSGMVDAGVLAVVVPGALILLLGYEVRLLTRRRELWFVHPAAGTPQMATGQPTGLTADGRDLA